MRQHYRQRVQAAASRGTHAQQLSQEAVAVQCGRVEQEQRVHAPHGHVSRVACAWERARRAAA